MMRCVQLLEIDEGWALLKKCDDLSAKKAAEEMLNELPAFLQIAVEAAAGRVRSCHDSDMGLTDLTEYPNHDR